jgi:hypothetical protein
MRFSRANGAAISDVFNLQHIHPKVGQHPRRHRPRHQPRQIEHAKTF